MDGQPRAEAHRRGASRCRSFLRLRGSNTSDKRLDPSCQTRHSSKLQLKRVVLDDAAGGGRGGGLGRKCSGGRTTYRRVQTSVSEEKTSPGGHRSVQVVDDASKQEDAAPAAPFQSSLRSSLRSSMEKEPSAVAKRSERSVRVEKNSPSNSDRSRERPSGRSSSPAPQKRDLQVQTKGPRQVISLSSPSPQKGAGQMKRFVSSLAQSMDREGDRGKQDREDRGGRGLQGSSLRRSDSREPVRRSSSREPLRRSKSREPRQRAGEGQGSYRQAERGSGSRSVSRTRLTRKNSTDSVSSQRSDRSDRSFRSERYSEEYRSSLHDGPQPVRRLSSGSSGPAPFKSSLAGSSLAGSLSSTMSSQDVRVQKERPSSGTIGRSFGRPTQDTMSRRSSLDGGASSLRKGNSTSPVESSAGSRAGPSDSQRSPSAPVGMRKNTPLGDSISPKPLMKSTADQEKESMKTPPAPVVKFTADQEKESVKAPPAPVVDEAERKRLTDTLRERMEARQKERGSSLAQMMKAPLNRKGSSEDVGNERASSGGNAEKEARTREYYAKLDKENTEREAARRAAPFKSSLTSSIDPTPARTQSSLAASIDTAPPRTLKSSLLASMDAKPVRTLKSSLAAALAPSRPTVSRLKKLQYSLEELRRFMAFALPKPADLPDMEIVDVIQVRDPSSVSKRSSDRLGAGYGIGRSIGGSIRRGDRSGAGGRGARSQGSAGGGRRDRQGRGSRGGGRGGRGGGGGGRGYGRPPPPPLYDGPIEPLKVTENRWKPTKEKEISPLKKTLNHVKSLLNKLTREKFAKLTNELCAVEIDSFVLLRYVPFA
ncbi:unnamed protein product [Phytophthora lilii]|uniref:Unnamed protein product n=1 Tax=Phytophthora lilii TaxID=2077276 RepID=A0A9W6YHQ5_9STRA|nr:unnamed protein product [Phytophthora lilii]